MNNIFPSNYTKPLFSNLNTHLHQSETNLINIVRNRKNILSPNNKLLSNNNINNKNLSKSKGTQSSTSSTLSTFRKTSNLYKTSAHNSCTNINKTNSSKHAVNIKANAKEINIHLSLNSDNTNNNNTHNNSSSIINIHNNSKCSSTYYEDIIKEQDQHIKQLKHELKEAKQILAAVKEYNSGNNSNSKLHKSYAHKKRHTINNDFNTLLGNTKSSWYVSTKTGNTPTSLLIGNKFGLWDGDNVTKRCVSPKGSNNIFFGLREHRKRNWSTNNNQDRLKTFSAKTQRTVGKRKGSNTEGNGRKNNGKKNNNKNVNVNDVRLMDNEELVCLCKAMIQRACKVFGMYNDIIRLNKIK